MFFRSLTQQLKRATIILLAAVSVTVALSGPAASQDGGLDMTLNRVKTSGEACRFTFIFRNALGAAIDKASFELVVFTEGGLVDRFVQITTGAMPKGKMRAKQFDFDKLDCAKVEKVLVNDVKACDGQGLDPAVCLARLNVSGNKSIELLL
ncbi:MAG: hypothetical protein AAF441_13300 [Pseudomonadota bacterium]